MLQFIYDIWEKTVDGCITYLSTLTFPPWFDAVGESLPPILNSINAFFSDIIISEGNRNSKKSR